MTFCQAIDYTTTMRKKNPLAVALGEMRAAKRFAGMTPEQISKEMQKVSLARFKDKAPIEIDPLTSGR